MNTIELCGTDKLDIVKTFECGQCFRWNADENGVYHGVAGENPAKVFVNGDKVYITSEAPESFWRSYFDMDTDYELAAAGFTGEYLERCREFGKGIRILRQEPWEALCSFIISQNNNIPRIKGIVSRLCENFGEKTGGGYTFPSAEVISNCTVEDLAPLRSGFRAKYIIDAAKKVSDGTVDFARIDREPIEFGRENLMQIKGVGAKVAECTLLYGFHKLEAFPVDVWVKRIMAEMYPDGLPECVKGTEGIAQQYLFHYRRNME